MARKKKTPAPPKPAGPKVKNDAWTGMLGVSLVALIGGCVLLFLDYQQYDYGKKPPPVPNVAPVGPEGNPAGGGQPGGVPPAGGQPGVPPAGGQPGVPPAGGQPGVGVGGNPAPVQP